MRDCVADMVQTFLNLIRLLALVTAVSSSRDGDGGRSKEDRFLRWQRGLQDEGDSFTFYRSLPIVAFRGGDAGCDPSRSICEQTPGETDIPKLIAELGAEFESAIMQNGVDHQKDCEESCKLFFCGMSDTTANSGLSYTSYSMGSVPPEDFQSSFAFPLSLIHVTNSTTPLLSAAESKDLVDTAESEGVSDGEYRSGKYRLGGDWLDNLPRTRRVFNELLEKRIFNEISALFPSIVSSPSVLRAHSVAMLRYNSSHPRTDVHVDNGILALTVALSDKSDFRGGGTYFEHLGKDNIVEMEIGGATFRPGSVRHGGSKVTSGVRYVLGAFILIEDR